MVSIGTYYYINGAMYTGDWKNEKKDGYGNLV